MKTLKSAVRRISTFIALVMFVVMLGVVKINSWAFFFGYVGVLGVFAFIAIWLTDKDIIVSKLVGLFCVVKAFKAEHSKKLKADELVLLRRKNKFGNYFDLFVDSVNRCYE